MTCEALRPQDECGVPNRDELDRRHVRQVLVHSCVCLGYHMQPLAASILTWGKSQSDCFCRNKMLKRTAFAQPEHQTTAKFLRPSRPLFIIVCTNPSCEHRSLLVLEYRAPLPTDAVIFCLCVAQSWLKDREGWWIMMIKWRGLGSRMWPCYFLLDRLPSLPLAPGRNCNPQSSRSPIPKTTQPVPVPHSSADGSAECEEASPRMILCMDSLGRVPFKA